MIIGAKPTNTFLGVCPWDRRPVRGTVENATGRYAMIECPQCRRNIRGERLHATQNAEPCHGACISAYGPSCSCGCGGTNHGRLYTTTGEATDSAIEQYRTDVVKRDAEARRRADKRRADKRAQFDAWAADHRDVIDFLRTTEIYNGFLDDVTLMVERYEPLTPNQAAAVRRFIATAAAKAQTPPAAPAPTGKALTITGRITATSVEDNKYGPGASYRMLIIGAEGWEIWSTIPADLRDQVATISDLKGRTVQFTADVIAGREPHKANAKRPRKATLTAEPAAA